MTATPKNSPYALFSVDNKAQEEGVWIPYRDNEDKELFAIKITRAGDTNPRYLKALEKHTRALTDSGRARRRHKEPSLTQGRAALVQVFADCVVLDWRGVIDKQGEILEFNRQNVVTLLTDLPDLFTDLLELAQRIDIFQAGSDETDAKN